jgi:hypothetical protein
MDADQIVIVNLSGRGDRTCIQWLACWAWSLIMVTRIDRRIASRKTKAARRWSPISGGDPDYDTR